jgi:hypothetical protein
MTLKEHSNGITYRSFQIGMGGIIGLRIQKSSESAIRRFATAL